MVRRKTNLDWLVFIMMIMSSLVVFQYSGMTFFLLLQTLYCLLMALNKKKIIICCYPMINFIFIELVITALSAIVGNMRYSYKKSAVIMVLMMIPLYFTSTYIYDMLKKDSTYIKLIVKALKVMCLIQLIWIPLQFVTYHVMGFDINKIIFVDIFHFVENATFIRSWVYYPSGFSWHSAVLAPMFVFAMVLFDNIFVRTLILIDAIICGNSTSIIGVLVCCSLLIFFKIVKNQDLLKMKKRTFFAILGVIVFGIIIIYRFNMVEALWNNISYLWNRLFGSERDASTEAHFGYFLDYPIVVNKSSIFQVLFGYGYGCSGYPITMMYNRYSTLTNWAVECDIINILISRGIVGFIGYYIFLFYVAIKGLKIDYKYFVVMFSIIIEGFGYNVQWDYVFLIEILMFFTIKLNINFFEPVSLFANKKKRSVRVDMFYMKEIKNAKT